MKKLLIVFMLGLLLPVFAGSSDPNAYHCYYRELKDTSEIRNGMDIIWVMSDGTNNPQNNYVVYMNPTAGKMRYEAWDVTKQKEDYILHLIPFNQYGNLLPVHYVGTKTYYLYCNSNSKRVYCATYQSNTTVGYLNDGLGHFSLYTTGGIIGFTPKIANQLVIATTYDTPANQFEQNATIDEVCQYLNGYATGWRIFAVEQYPRTQVFCYSHGDCVIVYGPHAVLPDTDAIVTQPDYTFLYWQAEDGTRYHAGDTIDALEDMSINAVYAAPWEDLPTEPDTIQGSGLDGLGYSLFGQCAVNGDTAYKYIRGKIDEVLAISPNFAYNLPEDFDIQSIQIVDSPIIAKIAIDNAQPIIHYAPYPHFVGVDGFLIKIQGSQGEKIMRIDVESCNEYTEDGYDFAISFIRNATSKEMQEGASAKNYMRLLCGLPTKATVTDHLGQVTTIDIAPNTYQEFTFPFAAATAAQAIWVHTSAPIAVETHNWASYTGDATSNLPICNWGTEFMLHTAQWTTTTPNTIAIIASEDNTTVTLDLTLTVNKHPAHTPFTITMQRGEVYRFNAPGMGYNNSFSGSYISSDHPIAIYQGTPDSKLIPPNGGNGGANDHLEEMVRPINLAAGTEFFLIGGTDMAPDYAEFIALEDNTTIFADGYPNAPFDRGQSRYFPVAKDAISHITSDKPIVGQYFMCGGSVSDPVRMGDPDQYYLPPLSAFHPMSMFSCQRLSGGYYSTTRPHHDLNIVASQAAANTMTIDGSPITGFKRLPNTNLCYKHLEIPNNLKKGMHTINADSGFIATLYGIESAESYSYALPLLHSHKPLIKTIEWDTICKEDNYRWRGKHINQSGFYTDTVRQQGFIREVHILNLLAKPCNCDTVYSTTYQQVRKDKLPQFEWNGITIPSVPHNEKQDTILVYPTIKADASCDSIAILHLHILNDCELPTTIIPISWKKSSY